MTDRRPHWTNGLIEAVGDAIADMPAYDWQSGTVRDFHTLIAIVEDYLKDYWSLGLPLDGDGTEDNQADFWDGDVPLGGDDMDGR